MRMSGRAKIFVSLPIEFKHILTIFVLFGAIMSVYHILREEMPAVFIDSCIFGAVGFALFYTVLRFVFNIFTGKKVSALAVSASAILLMILLRNRELSGAKELAQTDIRVGLFAGIVYLLWLLLQLWSDKPYLEAVLCFMADTVMVYMYFNGRATCFSDLTGKTIYSVLFVLTAFHLRSLIGIKRGQYPFVFFLVLLIPLLLMPVKEEPIDWDPVINAGRRVADKTREMAWSWSYFFSDLGFGSAYYTGYSSFIETGDALHFSERTEIELKTRDNTTFKYTDEQTGKKILRRRTVYLTGGRTIDHDQLLDVVFSLYAHGVDPAQAELFLRNTRLDITYIYLKTDDEIVPSCTLKLTDNNGNIINETSHDRHKKGYVINADYLDLDYGSPYLVSIMASETNINKKSVNYDDMRSYVFKTLGIQLGKFLDEETYVSWQNRNSLPEEYLDTSGATRRMSKLASEITKDAVNDYEKCKAIEAYLRQYTYSTNTGTSGPGNTRDAEGMSSIADNFLFDTERGYCVHYASSMVMLLRLNGIPARFTKGYRYAFPFDRQDKYEVRGKDAHAWPEAYIKGFGWVNFEPTSVLSTAEERTWHRHPVATGDVKQGNQYKVNTADMPHPVSFEPEDVPVPDEKDIKINSLIEAAKIAVIIMAAVILMAVILVAGSILLKTARYKKADPNARLMLDVADIIGSIKTSSGQWFEDRGVISDYSPFIPGKYRDEVNDAFKIYYRIKYRCSSDLTNKEKVTEQEGLRVRELRNRMHDEYSMRYIRRRR